MPRKREHSQPTRQLYASIREDIYLAAKTRAAEMRLPMRRFIEEALWSAINAGSVPASQDGAPSEPQTSLSLWDDEYLAAQARLPLGAPLDLSEDESRRVAIEAFSHISDAAEPIVGYGQARLESRTRGHVGDPIDLSEEDAVEIAREFLNIEDLSVRGGE